MVLPLLYLTVSLYRVNTKDRIGKKMLDEYYRNGELFIAELIRRREENKAFLTT